MERKTTISTPKNTVESNLINNKPNQGHRPGPANLTIYMKRTRLLNHLKYQLSISAIGHIGKTRLGLSGS